MKEIHESIGVASPSLLLRTSYSFVRLWFGATREVVECQDVFSSSLMHRAAASFYCKHLASSSRCVSPHPHSLDFFFHFVSRVAFLSKYVVHVSTEHGHYTIYFIIRVASTPTAAVSTLLLDDKDHGIKIFDGFVPLTRFARSKHTA